jgi:hypothetical protein
MTGKTNTRNCNKATTSALRPMERARGQDYAGAAECFVDAFFLKRNGGGDRITKSELAYLNGAQRKDLVSRYNQKNKGHEQGRGVRRRGGSEVRGERPATASGERRRVVRLAFPKSLRLFANDCLSIHRDVQD